VGRCRCARTSASCCSPFICFGDSHDTVAARLRIVARRQTYLDELERRAPAQLGAWLAAGARAAGDPSKFICPDATGRADDQR
jgi:hypothetical protein